jgi:SAM-dependent methyltransferase
MVESGTAAQPVSTLMLARAHLLDSLRSVARMALRRRRDEKRVAEEYDRGLWERLLSTRRWECAHDAIEFLVGADDGLRLCKIAGCAVRMPERDYYRFRIHALVRLMETWGGGVDTLVELGCGSGYNLLALATAARWRTLLGFDISFNAISAARQIAAHFGLSGLRFDVMDITEPGHPAFHAVSGRTVFTYFCLEQVPHAVPGVIDNLLMARPRRVIHIEPAAEFLDLSRPADWSNYLYVKSVDYQRCLRATLRARAREGRVQILEERRLEWAPTLHNDGSIMVWEPAEGR